MPHAAPSRPVLPAAVSVLSDAVVGGGPVAATVLGVHGRALYLEVAGRVLPVVTSDAVPLPTALRLGVAGGHVEWGVGAGDVVPVGAGRVVLPGVDLVVSRTWRPARVRRIGQPAHPTRPTRPARPTAGVGCSGGRPGSHLSTQLEVGGVRTELGQGEGGSGWLADGIRSLLAGVGCSGGRPGSHLSTQLEVGGVRTELGQGEGGSGWLADGIRSLLAGVGCSGGRPDSHLSTKLEVDGLLGRGPGLTPSGDDALAGILLVTHALGVAGPLAAAVRARLGATTAVSAALLDAAADGFAAPDVVVLVDALLAGDDATVTAALPAVLAIGHTSGRDLVAGIAGAVERLTDRTPSDLTPTRRSVA